MPDAEQGTQQYLLAKKELLERRLELIRKRPRSEYSGSREKEEEHYETIRRLEEALNQVVSASRGDGFRNKELRMQIENDLRTVPDVATRVRDLREHFQKGYVQIDDQRRNDEVWHLRGFASAATSVRDFGTTIDALDALGELTTPEEVTRMREILDWAEEHGVDTSTARKKLEALVREKK